ncbi:hypothetical protein V5738_13990 [Salinisphaera sp. SPP-AMP-43]|uniref:hypothetical protein n=1 Tax=Salinisphaera sp. SPP-AMP-43 TaxID=3121288 RepID=UPI003C6DED5F
MSRPDRSIRIIGLLSLLFSSLTLSGCSHDPAQQPIQPRPPKQISSPALALLSYAHRLAETTPSGREEAVRAARHQVRDKPDATSYAYLALALGTPHQHLYTPDEAARYAQLALDAENAPWDTVARQYLSDYARLYSELTELQDDDDEQRINDLKQRLEKAQRKLKALSNLENRLDNVENSP